MLARVVASMLTLSWIAPPAEATEPPAVPVAPPAPVLVPPPPPQPIEVDPANYRMVVAGDVLVGLGGVAFIVMAVGLGVRADAKTQRDAQTAAEQPDQAERDRQQRRLETGVGLALGGGIAAAVLIGTGVGLIAGGRARERRRREALVHVPLPWSSPRGAGLTWSLQF